MISIEPLGDRAFLARFATEDQARGWADSVRDHRFDGVVDIVLAYRAVAAHADPDRVDMETLGQSVDVS